jgi:hypothetical protein
MSIWNYPDRSLHPGDLADLKECPFCSIPLQRLFCDQRLSKSHNQNYDDLLGFVCETCGWWKMIRETGIWGLYSQTRHMSKFAYQKFCQAGSLMNFDPGDLTLLMEELRSALSGRDSSRLALGAQQNEEIVASIVAVQGYELLVIAHSNNGDMVMILTKGGKRTGLYMRSCGSSFAVECILEVSGALVRAGSTKGIFVIPCRSPAESQIVSRQFHAKIHAIELVDAQQLYEVLGLVRIPQYGSQNDFLGIHSPSGMVRVKASDGF